MNFSEQDIDWEKTSGLVPAIVQDAASFRVLMLGYMNREALATTAKTGLVTFFSRSRQKLWQKGETSGHVLKLKEMRLDCDQDTILVLAEPVGPTCHTGATTCFGEYGGDGLARLADLATTIKQRRRSKADNSYTAKLFADGLSRIAQKVGEEGVETALAGATQAPNLNDEAADLLYHLLVLLEARDSSLSEVLAVLDRRAAKGNRK
jgi:phosphoribosyl-ATP pyrophosphohydrolase/phosphoribosyl-AMP cyclohydrolase